MTEYQRDRLIAIYAELLTSYILVREHYVVFIIYSASYIIKDMATTKKKSTAVSGSINLLYINAYGTVINKTLDRIVTASVPDRFTLDFLSTKLKGWFSYTHYTFFKTNWIFKQ